MGANPNIFTNKENRRVVPPGDENFFVTAEEFKAIDTAFASKADQTAFDTLEGRVDTTETDIDGLQTQVGIIEGNLTIAEGNIGTLLSDVSQLQADTTPSAIVDKLESITDEESKLQVTAIQNFEGEVREIIDLTDVNTAIDDLQYLHENLAAITEFDERCEYNSRTRFKKLIHTNDRVKLSEDMHNIPSYKSSTALQSVWPNTLLGDLELTSDHGYAVSKPLEGGYGKLVFCAANEPRVWFDQLTGEYFGVLLEDQITYAGAYSHDFTQTAWTTNAAGVTVGSSTVESVFDGLNYQRITETAVTDQHRIRQHLSAPYLGNAFTGYWLTVFTPKTGNTRNIGLEFSTGGAARAIFDTTTGTQIRGDQADFIRTEVEDWGDHWRFGLLMSTSSTSAVRGAINLRVGDSTANYLGDTGQSILVLGGNIVGVSSLDDPMPTPNLTSATAIVRNADALQLTDWVTKGFMGAYSGQATSIIGDDEIVDSWEGDQLTVITNGTAAAPVTQAIPTDYTVRTGFFKGLSVKKISDDAPVTPPSFDFDLSRGFATMFNLGAGVDGGGAATPIVVTNLTQFEDNFSGNNKVLDIQSNIDLQDIQYSFGSNVTIMSTTGARLQYGQFRFEDTSNVKIENIERRKSYNDLMNFKNVDGILIKHVKFDGEATVNVRTVASSSDVDSQVFDGLLDFSNGASNDITVMFCQFLNHNKCSIINLDSETERTSITMAWNYFFNVYQRTPRAQICDLDLVNNLFSQCRLNMSVENNANVIARKNYYENCNENWRFRDTTSGIILSDDNLYVNVSTVNPSRNESSVFTLPVDVSYAITPLANTDVKAFVLANSGNVLHTL